MRALSLRGMRRCAALAPILAFSLVTLPVVTHAASGRSLRFGELAADAITEGHERNDLSGAQLGQWATDFKRGMDRMRRLVIEYYDGFSFGRYVKKNPEQKGHLTDLLIGDLFKESVDEVVEPMNLIKAENAPKAMVAS